MEESPMFVIRDNTRYSLKINRQTCRDEESDVQRRIKDLKITPRVEDIAHKLKTKAHIKLSELQFLKNALIDDAKNIELVLEVNGALRGLIREISGHEVNKQCAAVGCLCNLALGDTRCCAVVAKAAGPYLVTALDSLTTEFAVLCAWSIGNLAGSGTKVCEILSAQGAIAKLTEVLSLKNPEVQDAAVYALTHLAFHLKDELKTEYLPKILEGIMKNDVNMTSAQLLFILSCHKDFVPTDCLIVVQKILKNIPDAIENHLSCERKEPCCHLEYLLRTLANAEVASIYSEILDCFVTNKCSDNLKYFLKSENKLSDTLLWLLGNLFKNSCNHVFFNHFFN